MNYRHVWLGASVISFVATGCSSMSPSQDDGGATDSVAQDAARQDVVARQDGTASHMDATVSAPDAPHPSDADSGPSNVTDATPFHPPSCSSPVTVGLPSTAPQLVTGRWVDIRPQPWPTGVFTQGIAVHPCNPAILYVGLDAFDVSLGGLFRSTNAGGTWSRIGRVQSQDGTETLLDEPIRIRIDPRDPQHMYVVDGVRGGTNGFFVSHDGGDTFVLPQSFRDLSQTDGGFYQYDLYDIATDPTDFNHLLVTAHGAWGWDNHWHMNSGVLESRDGGDTWIIHAPIDGWGTGHSVSFLFDPVRGVGDSNTWLVGTQGDGKWRTTDAGNTWTQVTQDSIQHGGGNVYYSPNGVLYAAGTPNNVRSTDNGLTWTEIGEGHGYNTIFGDGTHLWTAPCFGPTEGVAFRVANEVATPTWADFNDQLIAQGPYEMAYDSVNRILYSASWGGGVWALKEASP